MKNSELYQLAFQCLVNEQSLEFNSFFKNKILPNEELLSKFIQLSSDHLVLPAVYRRLQKTGLSDYIPSELAEHLNEILQLNIKRNEEILQQIEEISAYFNKAGIEPVYLKGTANLLHGLYTDTADRMIGDIDFLVKEKDYFKAAELIKKLGYKQTEVIYFDELNTLTHFPRLFRQDVPADIEIHRSPVGNRFTSKFNSDNIFDIKVSIPTIQNCYVTCDEHKLIHTFIHSQLSHKGHSYRIASLRDLYDFYLISKRIDFYSVLPIIEEKKKASSFFSLAQYMFEPENSADFANKQINNKYVRQIIWFLNHPKLHRLYINSLKATDIFIERPFNKIKNALFFKSSRNSLIKRLKNPDWYSTIYNGIKSHFK